MHWVVVRLLATSVPPGLLSTSPVGGCARGGKNHTWEQVRSPFLCGFAVSLQRPLGAELQLAPAGKDKGSQSPALASQRQADRVDLELRDNKLMTGTVRSQKDGGKSVPPA